MHNIIQSLLHCFHIPFAGLVRRNSARRKSIIIALFSLGLSGAHAHDLDTLLVLKNTKTLEEIHISDQDLIDLPQREFSTATPWADTVKKYKGPSLIDVLTLFGPISEMAEIRGIAANDFAATFTKDLITKEHPIVANRINGEPFSLRHKGPLWVMYPFDDIAIYGSGAYYLRSIWQLTTIEITPK